MNLAVWVLSEDTFSQMRPNKSTTTGDDDRTEVRRGGLPRHGDNAGRVLC